MKKILLLFISTILISCNEKPRKSIIFIAIDDFRNDLISDKSLTPNINNLINDGVYFKNHYVQSPSCGPSRYSMIYSHYPRNYNETKNEVFTFNLNNGYKSKIEGLKLNDIKTILIGKISHSPDGYLYNYTEAVSNNPELPNSWSEIKNSYGKWKTGWNAFFGYSNGTNRNDLKNLSKPYEIADDSILLPDELNKQLAIEKIIELKNSNEDFMLSIGFYKPHLPFITKKSFYDKFDSLKLPTYPNEFIKPNKYYLNYHPSNEFNSYKLGDIKVQLDSILSFEYSQKLKKVYYSSASFIDQQIGEILNTLKENNLYENSMIIIWSDHGFLLGEHNIWGKHTLFEEILNSPLIMKFPKSQERKIDSSKFGDLVIESIDIFPTIYDFYDISDYGYSDGKSIFKNINNDYAMSYFKNGGSIRSKGIRLTSYYDKESQKNIDELYDIKDDKYQLDTIPKNSYNNLMFLKNKLIKNYKFN